MALSWDVFAVAYPSLRLARIVSTAVTSEDEVPVPLYRRIGVLLLAPIASGIVEDWCGERPEPGVPQPVEMSARHVSKARTL